MWRGHLEALGRYGLVVARAWVDRGFSDTTVQTIRHDLAAAGVVEVREQDELAAAGALPAWLGTEEVHRSHRSALLRKDPAWYRPLFPDDPDDLPYVWPVRSAAAVEAERRRAERAANRRS
jgi:hypothetical protein